MSIEFYPQDHGKTVIIKLLHIYSEDATEIEKGVCFVCGKILVEGQTVQELTKFGIKTGTMCSKACVDKFWDWWHQQWEKQMEQ